MKIVKNQINKQNHEIAFTLAEVLITMAIIGVVAAITIPNIMKNITATVWANKEANVAYKITQAVDKMRALGELETTYNSTDEFVDNLQKHLKIIKRCNKNNIAACWSTSKIIDNDGNEFDVSRAKTGKNLSLGDGYSTDNVGLILADGTSIILNYNTQSSPVYATSAPQWTKKSIKISKNKSKEYAYTSDSTNMIAYITDVNGAKSPNRETNSENINDIRSFNGARFSSGCDLEFDNKCFVYMGKSSWYDYEKICQAANMQTLSFSYMSDLHDDIEDNGIPFPTDSCYWGNETSYFENSSKRMCKCFSWHGGYGYTPEEKHNILCATNLQ